MFVLITRAQGSCNLQARGNKTCFRDSLDYLAAPAVYRARPKRNVFRAFRGIHFATGGERVERARIVGPAENDMFTIFLRRPARVRFPARRTINVYYSRDRRPSVTSSARCQRRPLPRVKSRFMIYLCATSTRSAARATSTRTFRATKTWEKSALRARLFHVRDIRRRGPLLVRDMAVTSSGRTGT